MPNLNTKICTQGDKDDIDVTSIRILIEALFVRRIMIKQFNSTVLTCSEITLSMKIGSTGDVNPRKFPIIALELKDIHCP